MADDFNQLNIVEDPLYSFFFIPQANPDRCVFIAISPFPERAVAADWIWQSIFFTQYLYGTGLAVVFCPDNAGCSIFITERAINAIDQCDLFFPAKHVGIVTCKFIAPINRLSTYITYILSDR